MAAGQPPHAVGVCGFGRCGTTMVMGMLTAGGLPAAADAAHPWELTMQELRAVPLGGRAVKLLDIPRNAGLPPAPGWRFVWLDRDPVEQAKSQAKMMDVMLGHRLTAVEVARFAVSYTRDRPYMMDLLSKHGHLLVLRYEQVLAQPRRAARLLRRVWPGLDVTAAAAVVHQRDGRCRPDMQVEESGGRLPS